eukprot:m.157160 g.157160  ORF g.157160 m.157160 type:complete len:118 (-) comp31042_c2_seq3:659-1012(-)
MATASELQQAIKKSLEQSGKLESLRSQIRADVYQTINDETIQPPKMSNENVLINELIREYLVFNEYNCANSTFVAETGIATKPLDRKFVADELSILEPPNTQSIPLLYSILAHLQSK